MILYIVDLALSQNDPKYTIFSLSKTTTILILFFHLKYTGSRELIKNKLE